MTLRPQPVARSAFGQLLQGWRHVRGKSQLDLSLDARVSSRHLSFLETGRSSPSRDMVLSLAAVLNVPLRERNTLLVAAGYAPLYRETDLAASELEPARRALDLILGHQEPYPAVVMNRQWDLVTSNQAARRLFSFLLSNPEAPGPEGPANVLRLLFHPAGLRPHVGNWEAVAEGLIQRVHREALGGVPDDGTRRLLTEVLAYPGVPARWRRPDLALPLAPVVPVAFRKGDFAARFFSAVTTLGTPQDITLQELRVESFFPADAETEEQILRLRDADGEAGARAATPPAGAPSTRRA